jgi:glycosyltransferase involved in cell wall biosynthesis
MTRPALAIVVQRYGADITGGSESLARSVAERLTAFYDVTAFTTCARDYVTWRNEMPAGDATLTGVRVRRFPVEEERDLAAFNAFAEPLYGREHTDEEEQLFLRRQGPFAPRLVEALAAERGRFAAVVFFTYLYYPTYAGLRAAPERSVLVPTAHDEPPLRFRVYAQVFALARGFGFLTGPEEALVRSRFALGDRPALVTGMGVETPESPDVEGFRIRYDLEQPFVLYAGRIDAGKGCAEMLAHYARYRRDVRGAASLVLIGKLAMPEPREAGVRYLGYLSEEEKAAALAGARAVICPSSYESLSIVLLEGMALGTPALATARSAVLLDHCRRSNAGLWYRDPDEFVEALDLLVREERLRETLGANGRAYVRQGYRWDAVIERYRSLIEAVAGA